MFSSQNKQYLLLACHKLPNGTMHSEVIVETNNRDLWLNVQRAALIAYPKQPKRLGPNGRERAVFVVKIDRQRALEAKSADQLSRIPMAGEQFASIAACAAALGMNAASLNQGFHRAKKKAGPEGNNVKLHGVELNYAPQLSENVSI